MTFSVYPEPQTKPLEVGAGATSGLQQIDEHAAPDPASGVTVMWIKVALVGPATMSCPVSNPAQVPRPTVILQAGASLEREVLAFPDITAIRETVGGQTVTIADATMDLASFGVVQVRVFLRIPGRPWQLRIRNNDPGAAHAFTWVVGSTEAEASQPWIDVPRELPYDVLTGQSVPLVVQAANRGPGRLQITSPVGTALGGGFTLTGVPPGPIEPNACGALQVTFQAPAAPGQASADFLVASNDQTATVDDPDPQAAHNRKLALTATTRALEIALVLDASGSMATRPDGNPAGSPTDARWSKLQFAAGEFLNLLSDFGAGTGSFGVAVFPDVNQVPAPPSSAGDVLAGPSPIDQGNIATAITRLGSLAPGGRTPMGDGIVRAMAETSGSFGYFHGDPASLQFNRRWMVVMSDGAHNDGPPDPPQFYGVGPTSFKGKKIRVISLAYGDPGAWEVDHKLLNDLVAQSDGIYLDAGAQDARGLDLAKEFRAALVAGLSLDPTSDPRGRLTAAAPEVRRRVTVTPYDTKVSFVVNWGTFDPDRVAVSLLTPTCELITPAAAEADPRVAHHGDPRYQIYTFDHDFLRNAGDPATPRFGEWTLVIAGNGLAGTAGEDFEYEVITDSRLKLALAGDRTRYHAGLPIRLAARLTLDGVPIPEATVTLRLTAPGRPADNWLAGEKVSAAELADADQALRGKEMTALGVKAHALKLKGRVLGPFESTTTMAMVPDGDAYAATVRDTRMPGTYDCHVTATGQTPDGVAFRREQRLQVRVGIRPDPRFTLLDTVYRVQFVDGQRVLTANVTAHPADHFGNVLLVDPAVDRDIQLTVRGGEPAGALTGNLNGSYSQLLRYPPGTRPVMGLQVAGAPVLRGRAVAPVEELAWAERVVDFQLGGEAKQGANRHRNPEAVLGEVTMRDDGEFLSLGAGGMVAVAPRESLIRPQGDDDVVVFVQPDEDLRPYLVEALAVQRDSGQRWVRLGASRGETASFGLRNAELRAARAVRVTDLSDRTVDAEFHPTTSPGVSLRGVGFRLAAPGPGGLLAECLASVDPEAEKALATAGIVTVGQLAGADPAATQVGLPEMRRRELHAAAQLTLRGAAEVEPVPALGGRTVWELLELPIEQLAAEAGAEPGRVARLREQLGRLQVTLGDRCLQQLTLDELTGAGPAG